MMNGNPMPMSTEPLFDPSALSPAADPWCRDYRNRAYTFDEAREMLRAFHGFPAPGLVLGVKMVTLAMEHVPRDILFDAISETASCLPDAVQVLTLCTIGNGWLKVMDMGKFAVTLYDKTNGSGIRVFLDPVKLRPWPEYESWFYKQKPKKAQDAQRLMREIHMAGASVLSLAPVQVQPRFLVKSGKGAISTCPVCGEAFPAKDGAVCRGCRGESPYQSHPSPPADPAGPVIRAVPLEQAVGRRIVHDMTRILPGKEKGPAFTRGQTIAAGDLCRLQKMGRRTLYVEDEANKTRDWVHENDAARAFAQAMSGPGVTHDPRPREGKINLTASRDGLLTVDTARLAAFNQVNGVMAASRHAFEVVKAREEIAGTRAIPLYLSLMDFHRAMAVLEGPPLFAVLPLRKARVGVLVTGTEVFQGLVKDSFIPIIAAKLSLFGCEMADARVVPDERKDIREGISRLLEMGADLIVTTAGLSVDPDDVTRLGLMDAGCVDILYGAPILPGAMTLLGRIGAVQVIGVPACGLYHSVTSFDLILPRLLAGQTLTRADLAAYGHGGFCRNCTPCTHPRCGFGK